MAAEFNKISIKSVKDAFIDEILHKIISGELEPGDRLPPERELAAALGISRSIVNQGLLQLESMGFVAIRPRHGTVVCDFRKYPTPQSLDALMRYGSSDIGDPLFSDMMEFRILLERECAGLACENAYDSTLDKMEEQLLRMEAGPEDTADAQYLFHYRLTQASGNSVYSMIFRAFEPVIRALIQLHYDLVPSDWKDAAAMHRRLLEALRRKDKASAQTLCTEIISHGIDVIRK